METGLIKKNPKTSVPLNLQAVPLILKFYFSFLSQSPIILLLQVHVLLCSNNWNKLGLKLELYLIVLFVKTLVIGVIVFVTSHMKSYV